MNNPATQQRPFEFRDQTRQHGRTTVLADCPFCQAVIVVFVWSFHGSGKKKCACGATLCRDGFARKNDVTTDLIAAR